MKKGIITSVKKKHAWLYLFSPPKKKKKKKKKFFDGWGLYPHVSLKQAWATSGPWATCGLWHVVVRPSEVFFFFFFFYINYNNQIAKKTALNFSYESDANLM